MRPLVRFPRVLSGLGLALSISMLGACATVDRPSDRAARFNASLRAYKAGDHATARRLWHSLAEEGHIEAQYFLGLVYRDGSGGVPKNHAEAVRWFRKAAEQGHARAQYELSGMYSRGEGVPRNDAETARWLRKAAEQGHAEAQFYLGVMYAFGQGVPENPYEALIWLRKAADQGHKEARDTLQKLGGTKK